MLSRPPGGRPLYCLKGELERNRFRSRPLRYGKLRRIHFETRAVRVAASNIVALKIDCPERVRRFFHRTGNAARAAMRTSDAESHAAVVRNTVVRALTAPRSIGEGLTSRFTPTRGRADAESENKISKPAGVL